MAKGNKILASAGILLVGAAIVTGATYALFTTKSTVNNHLQAGNLAINLYRTSYREHTFNDKGLLETTPADTTPVDLNKDASKVFAVDGAVPGAWYEATVEVKNSGSLAVDYGVRVLWNEDGKASAEEVEFASQMEITVTYGNNQSESFLLSESANKNVDIGLIYRNESGNFTVTAAFLEGDDNDEVQNQSVEFDLQVYATQHSAK